MTLDLTDIESRVRSHEGEWHALALEVTVKPIPSNHGKTSGLLKHYDLDAMAQLDSVLAELITLVRDGSVQVDAVTSWL